MPGSSSKPSPPSVLADDSAQQLPETIFDPSTCRDRGFCSVSGDSSSSGTHKIYYELHGDGPEKVIFIMGLKNTSFSWERQVAHFASDRRYSVLVFDNRGAGYSSTPRGPWTTGAMARDALELMDHIGWVKERDVHVVGISLGGMIALKLASINPMRCASLLLAVTTAGHGIRRKLPPFEGLRTTATNLFDDLERYMLMLYPAEWLDDTDPEDPQGRTNRETRIEEFKSRNKLTNGQSAAGQFWQLTAATMHYVSNEELETIDRSIPKVVILSGKNDKLVPPDSSANLKKHVPDADLVEWDESGHAIHSQHPQRFNALCQATWSEGRLLSGPPRTLRTDSIHLYQRERDESRQSSLSFANYYPKTIIDLLDRMWTSSSSPNPKEPVLDTLDSSPDTGTVSPPVGRDLDHERSPAYAQLELATGTKVSFAQHAAEMEPAAQSHALHPPFRLREAVEKVFHDSRPRRRSDGGVTSNPRGRPHFLEVVDKLLRERGRTTSRAATAPVTPTSEPSTLTNRLLSPPAHSNTLLTESPNQSQDSLVGDLAVAVDDGLLTPPRRPSTGRWAFSRDSSPSQMPLPRRGSKREKDILRYK